MLQLIKRSCIQIISSCLIATAVIAFFPATGDAQALFGGRIYVPAKLDKEVVEAVNDMAYWLEKLDNRKYDIREAGTNRTEGIHLRWADNSELTTDQRRQLKKDGQSTYLNIDGRRHALIVGTGKNSFINGIYTFLHELGFRWYMPGDNWVKIPDAGAINKIIDKLYTPSFQNRGYFGTGGIGPLPGIDDKNSFKKDFDDWNRRNRLSSEFTSKGHIGQVFYKENKAVLDKNPSYSCNGVVSTKGRIDISNPKAVDLFINWAVNKIDFGEKVPMVGVDPADGSGGKDDCLPRNMQGIATWSDKYFWLANKVAERLDRTNKDALVQTYAYASHAETPSFELNPRVYPIIIPYAFQRVTDPVTFIKQWSEKTGGRPMGIYDYWNITQWTKNEPQFNIYTIPQKLKLWDQYNVNFIRIESTNAKGPMGHAWWLAAQMMWDVSQSFEDLYREFLTDNFGAAAPDIRNMYDRWSLNYQGVMEPGFSAADLRNAAGKNKDARTQSRINELKAYVVYLEKYHSYLNNRTVQGYNDLIQYINSIHHLRLLQSRALQVLYLTPPAGYKKEATSQKVESKHIAVKPLDEKQIEERFIAATRNNPPAYQLSDFQFDIKRASSYKSIQKKHYNPLEINGTNYYKFYLPKSREIVIQVGATKAMRFAITDSSGKKWLQDSVKGSKSGYQTFRVVLSAGNYVWQVGELYMKSRFIFPEDIPLFTSNTYYDNHNYPLQYVYVPKAVNEIVYRDNIGPNKNKRGFWVDPSGKKIQPEQVRFNIYRIKVPPEHRGKIWVLNIGHRSYELLNLPNLFSVNEYRYVE